MTKANYWILGGILTLALLLRIPFLNGSFWLDEAAQALESARPWSQQLNIAEDFQPPLLHLIVKIALYVSTTEWWLRTIGALIPGLITIALTYYIGKRLVSEPVGILASLLLATNSWHIFYSQELRPYSLPTMWAVLSWWLLLPWLAQPVTTQLPKNKPFLPFSQLPRFIFLIAVSTAGLYSSFLYFLVLLAQVVVLFFGQRHKLYLAVIAFLMSGIFFAPWLPSFSEQLAVGGALRQALPGWEAVVSLTQAKALFITFGKFIFGTQNLDIVSPHTFMLVIYFGALLLIGWSNYSHSKPLSKNRWLPQFLFPALKKMLYPSVLQPQVIFFVWFILPILAAWLISFWIPILHPKRVLFCLPGWSLLMATYWYHSKIKTRWVLVSLLFIFNFWGLANLYTNPLVQREDWRSLHAELTHDYPATVSVAVFSFPQPFAPWRWYDDGSYPTLSTGTLHINQSDLRSQFKTLPNYTYVLVFDYLRDLSDPDDKLIQAIESYGFVETDNRSRPLVGQVRVFAKPTSILSSS